MAMKSEVSVSPSSLDAAAPVYIPLHVHSHYSLLESSIQIPALLQKVKSWSIPAVALTDHGNMFGAVDFYLAAKAAEIKPILGCEIFYTTGSRLVKSEKKSKRISSQEDDDTQRLFRLVLLAQNQQGYRNLCEIVTKAYMEGMTHRPRADRELIETYKEGLFALSSGLKGELAYQFGRRRPERAELAANWLQNTFGENLFLEIQENGLPEQSLANQALVDLAEKRGIGLVAACEAHYLEQEHAASQEVLMCIASGRTLTGVESPSSTNACHEFYLKSPETMATQFAWKPEALRNTIDIASRCNVHFKLKDDKGRQIYHLPQYQPGQWADTASAQPAHEGNSSPELVEQAKDASGLFVVEKYLRLLASQGLERRFQEPIFAKLHASPDVDVKKKAYYDRLEEELSMIEKTGFSGYFLIVADFILYAKSVGIPVGPGRGSGAGSLVAYALKITDIDPLPFNLLFERFINPERVSMPDFDVDFCQDRRGEVIDYVVKKYGKGCVSQIITFGKLLAKSVIRDVGRVLDMSYGDVDVLAKLIPDELGIDLEDAFAKEPRLKEVCEKDPKVDRLFQIARTLEGLNRNAGIHAAGVVITNQPLVEYGPLMAGKEGEAVVQFDKDFAEKIGLIKFDFLGLKTLTVIDNAVKLVHQGPNPNFELSAIDYEDKSVYELLSSGDTDGIFQLESSGMKDLCQRVMPSNLEDITSINALYRPGPLESGMVDDFINRKHGRTSIEYPMPQLEPILNETYGVIVYQEQVMRVARVLAGYSLGEADILRRAMGKKKPEEMAKQKDKFIKGCLDNKVPAEKADFIFELLAKFASYGFNKSHSAAYGVLSYQTAYLKRYYPAEFIAALMATEMDNTEKLTIYIADAKARGIDVLPPDVNHSSKKFSVQNKNIRFGIEAIKGVGGVAVDSIIREREEKGPYQSFLDFCKRVPLRKVNKKVLECLIQVGAFDSIAEENRATLQESLDGIMKYAADVQEQADLGQVSMFDDYRGSSLNIELSTAGLYKKVQEWGESERLQSEKALVGFYVSGHPMEKARPLVKEFIHGDLSKLKSDFDEKKLGFKPKPKQLDEFGRPVWDRSSRDYGKYDVVTAAVVASVREIMTKKGSRMAFCEIEDGITKIEGVVFPEPYAQLGELLQTSLKECRPMVVSGQMDLNEESPKILLRSLSFIEDYQKEKIQTVIFRLDPSKIRKTDMTALRTILMKHRGRCQALLEYEGSLDGTQFYSRHTLPQELMIDPTSNMMQDVNKLFGGNVVKFL